MVHETRVGGASAPILPKQDKATQAAPPGAATFADVLQKTQQAGRPGSTREVGRSRSAEKPAGLKFSAHAQQRMAQRQIHLSEGEMQRIEQAADKAADKGARESLFLMDKLGLIVNVRNRTVLTAVDPERLRDGIVTHIDSTVLIGGSQG